MLANPGRFAKEHGPRGDLVAEVETTSSGDGFVKRTKTDFREAMRLFFLFQDYTGCL
jgi:hypothetical protein